MKTYFRTVLFLAALLTGSGLALAVPPPDFLFNVGSQVVQIFAIVVLFLSALIGSMSQFLKVYFIKIKHKKLIWAGIGLLVVAIAFGFAYGYQQREQDLAYKHWLAESSQQNLNFSQEQNANSKIANGTPLSLSNQEFKDDIQNAKDNIFVLDAREDEEYNLGHFPNSNHVRFADLVAGEWKNLPKAQVIYVFCWSGIRGKEVAEFLRSKNLVARYLEKGADGWVSFGGAWEGEIKFSSKYSAENYKKLFTLEEVKQQIDKGVVIVDSRPAEKYKKLHLPGSINIPIIYTPASKIEELFGQIALGKAVITVCDDFVSCFDAKITGVKAEARGHQFLGRYNKPWEYK